MAALKVQFTSRALREMREILHFIEQDNPPAASALAAKIIKGLKHKAHYLKSGRTIPEASEHPARELVIPPCRIFQLPEESRLLVLALMRSERHNQRPGRPSVPS